MTVSTNPQTEPSNPVSPQVEPSDPTPPIPESPQDEPSNPRAEPSNPVPPSPVSSSSEHSSPVSTVSSSSEHSPLWSPTPSCFPSSLVFTPNKNTRDRAKRNYKLGLAEYDVGAPYGFTTYCCKDVYDGIVECLLRDSPTRVYPCGLYKGLDELLRDPGVIDALNEFMNMDLVEGERRFDCLEDLGIDHRDKTTEPCTLAVVMYMAGHSEARPCAFCSFRICYDGVVPYWVPENLRLDTGRSTDVFLRRLFEIGHKLFRLCYAIVQVQPDNVRMLARMESSIEWFCDNGPNEQIVRKDAAWVQRVGYGDTPNVFYELQSDHDVLAPEFFGRF